MATRLGKAMVSGRDWIKKHRTYVIITASIVGAGFICYRTVKGYQKNALTAKEEHEALAFSKHQAQQCIEEQLQAHFQSIQRLSDTTTLPSLLQHLKRQLFGLLDLSMLTEELEQDKKHSNLSAQHKIELWEKLKLLSFTRATCSMWLLTITVLFVRVQFNILAHHIYIDTARDISNAGQWDKKKALSKTCQQKYLMCSEFLVDQGVDLLKQDVEAAVSKTLGIKSLRDLCSLADLRDIFLNICLNLEHSQVEWLSDIILKKSVPEHALTPDEAETYEQLLGETRDIVQSQEFKVVLAASLKVVLDGVIQEFETEFKEKEFNRVHLAKLLPPVSCIGTLLLEHPDENRFIRSITRLQEMQSFCNLVYSTSGQSRESDL